MAPGWAVIGTISMPGLPPCRGSECGTECSRDEGWRTPAPAKMMFRQADRDAPAQVQEYMRPV